MSNKTAIIVGSTGLIGKFCLSYVLMDTNYTKVIAITRKPLNINDVKLENIVCELSDLSNYANKLIGDDIYCCLGTTIAQAGSQENFKKVDLNAPLELANICHKNGASQYFIVSAMGADASSSIFYNRVKGEMENQLKKIAFKSIHIFRPSLLTGMRKEYRLGEKIAQNIMRIFNPLLMGSLKKYKPIDGMVVAFAMHKKSQETSLGVFTYLSNEIQEIFDTRKK